MEKQANMQSIVMGSVAAYEHSITEADVKWFADLLELLRTQNCHGIGERRSEPIIDELNKRTVITGKAVPRPRPFEDASPGSFCLSSSFHLRVFRPAQT